MALALEPSVAEVVDVGVPEGVMEDVGVAVSVAGSLGREEAEELPLGEADPEMEVEAEGEVEGAGGCVAMVEEEGEKLTLEVAEVAGEIVLECVGEEDTLLECVGEEDTLGETLVDADREAREGEEDTLGDAVWEAREGEEDTLALGEAVGALPDGDIAPEGVGKAEGEALHDLVMEGEAEGEMRSAAAGMATPWKLYCEGAVATIPHWLVSVLNTRAWVGVVR